MDDEPKPDATERGTRFGCGVIAGAGAAFLLLVFNFVAFSGKFWVVVADSAFVFGLLAVRFGDRAWVALVRVISWIWR